MIKLLDILKEIKINKPSYIPELRRLLSVVESNNTTDKIVFEALVKVMKLLSSIWEQHFPEDNRFQKALNVISDPNSSLDLIKQTNRSMYTSTDEDNDGGEIFYDQGHIQSRSNLRRQISYAMKNALEFMETKNRESAEDAMLYAIQTCKNHFDIQEIKVVPPIHYKINPNYEFYLKNETDWDDVRYAEGEDTADAITLFDFISPNRKSITLIDIEKWLKKDEKIWGGTAEGLLKFLIDHGVIISK